MGKECVTCDEPKEYLHKKLFFINNQLLLALEVRGFEIGIPVCT